MPDQQITITAILRDRVSPGAKKVDDALTGIGATVDRVQRSTASLTSFVGRLVAGFGAIATAGRGFRAIEDFEVGLIGVGKTADIEGPKLVALGDDVLELATGKIPIATRRLLEIGEAAGQLGVKGADNIGRFIETIARLDVSSDLGGAEAATTLARIIELTETELDQVGEVGNVIVALGNNVAATEAEIAAVATRVAQATREFGLGAEKALAYGAALRELGVRGEAGATGIGRLFASIDQIVRAGGTALERVASIVGQTGEEFVEAFRTDPTATVNRYLAALGELSEKGASVRDLLNEIGIEGVESQNALLPLALGAENVARAFGIATEAIKNQVAIRTESDKFFDSIQSKMQRFSNTFDAVFIRRARVGQESGIVADFKSLIDIGSEALAILGGIEGAYEKASPAGQELAEVINAIVRGFVAFVQIRIGLFLGDIISYVVRLRTAFASLNATMALNPFGAVAIAIGTAVAAFSFFNQDVKTATDRTRELTKAQQEFKRELDERADIQARIAAAQRTEGLDDDIAAQRARAAINEQLRTDLERLVQERGQRAATPPEILIRLGIDPASRRQVENVIQDLASRSGQAADVAARFFDVFPAERLKKLGINPDELAVIPEIISNEAALNRALDQLDEIKEEIRRLERLKRELEAADLSAANTGATLVEKTKPFLDQLERQRELVEALTDADRTRLQILQEAERFAENEGFSSVAPPGEISQRDQFLALVEEQVDLLLKAIQATKDLTEEERRREAAAEGLRQFQTQLEAELDLTKALTGAQADQEAARQSLTRTVELQRLALEAGLAVSDEQFRSIVDLIAKLDEAAHKQQALAQQRSAQTQVRSVFGSLAEESRVLQLTSRLLRENEDATLDLNSARRIATEVARLERAAIVAGIDDVQALTDKYLELVEALERRERALDRQSFLRVLDEDASSFFDGFGRGFTRTASQLSSLEALGADVGASFVNAVGGVADALIRADGNLSQFAANFARQLAVMIIQALFLRAILAGIGLIGAAPATLGPGDVPAFDFFSTLPSIQRAEGGEVPGPPVRRDVVRALLMPKEWVIPVDSVEYYGRQVMEAMRRRLIPREVLQAATVGAPAPVRSVGQTSFQSGGQATIGGARRSDDGDRALIAYIPNDNQSAERLLRGGLSKPLLRWLEEKGFQRGNRRR